MGAHRLCGAGSLTPSTYRKSHLPWVLCFRAGDHFGHCPHRLQGHNSERVASNQYSPPLRQQSCSRRPAASTCSTRKRTRMDLPSISVAPLGSTTLRWSSGLHNAACLCQSHYPTYSNPCPAPLVRQRATPNVLAISPGWSDASKPALHGRNGPNHDRSTHKTMHVKS